MRDGGDRRQNVLKEKSYAFALRIVKLSRFLAADQKEFVLSRQVLRSGTSIGANIEEAFQGQSSSDFIHKLSIANKEAFETNYWLRLLRDSSMLTKVQADSLLSECEELQKMLTAAIKTSKAKLK
jgi:four helix bundle protein